MGLQLRTVAAVLAIVCSPAVLAQAPVKPNILFLFADDLAHDAVGFMGNTEVRTPNLDRLAAKGAVFTHAYNMGAWHGAVCVASRTMLNTGTSVWRARQLEPKLGDRLARGILGAAPGGGGYQTRMTGKWHVSAKAEKAFQVVKNIRPGMPRDVRFDYPEPGSGTEPTRHPWDPELGGFWQGGKHWSEVGADDAVAYIEEAARNPEPFFTYVAFNAPHDPRQSPKSFVDQYPYEKVSLPQPFLPEYPFDIGSNKIRDEMLTPFPRTEYNVRRSRGEYYAIITHLDAQIGRILEALDKSGEADNTWIFFTADHGLACGHHGLLGKQNMYDHSMRPPFLVVGPGVAPGSRLDTAIYLQDVMPTTLEIAGVPVPADVEFKSFLPQLRGRKEANYPAIYGAYVDHQRMVSTGRHKLIVYPKINKELLFDLSKDPLEIQDQAANPEYATILTDLRKKLGELQTQFADPILQGEKLEEKTAH